MRVRIVCAVALGVAAIGGLPHQSAQAGDQYQSTIVEDGSNTSDFHILKAGSKIVIKPSTKAGSGGVTFQLILQNVDCPAVGNDGSKAGKCGIVGAPAESPVRNHVVDMGVRAVGVELPGGGTNPSGAGILYRLEKGKAIFQATGKNTVGGGAFGALSTAIFNQPLGIGLLRMRTKGTNPNDCAVPPLLPGNGCNDGDIYAIAGITVGSDAGLTCSGNSSCSKTQICTGGVCATEPCTVDADCNDGGGVGGSGQCGAGGTCCDPSIDATCTSQVP